MKSFNLKNDILFQRKIKRLLLTLLFGGETEIAVGLFCSLAVRGFFIKTGI
jgi:hypothetical protein